jgi:hypothetical protein
MSSMPVHSDDAQVPSKPETQTAVNLATSSKTKPTRQPNTPKAHTCAACQSVGSHFCHAVRDQQACTRCASWGLLCRLPDQTEFTPELIRIGTGSVTRLMIFDQCGECVSTGLYCDRMTPCYNCRRRGVICNRQSKKNTLPAAVGLPLVFNENIYFLAQGLGPNASARPQGRPDLVGLPLYVNTANIWWGVSAMRAPGQLWAPLYTSNPYGYVPIHGDIWNGVPPAGTIVTVGVPGSVSQGLPPANPVPIPAIETKYKGGDLGCTNRYIADEKPETLGRLGRRFCESNNLWEHALAPGDLPGAGGTNEPRWIVAIKWILDWLKREMNTLVVDEDPNDVFMLVALRAVARWWTHREVAGGINEMLTGCALDIELRNSHPVLWSAMAIFYAVSETKEIDGCAITIALDEACEGRIHADLRTAIDVLVAEIDACLSENEQWLLRLHLLVDA